MIAVKLIDSLQYLEGFFKRNLHRRLLAKIPPVKLKVVEAVRFCPIAKTDWVDASENRKRTLTGAVPLAASVIRVKLPSVTGIKPLVVFSPADALIGVAPAVNA